MRSVENDIYNREFTFHWGYLSEAIFDFDVCVFCWCENADDWISMTCIKE